MAGRVSLANPDDSLPLDKPITVHPMKAFL